MRLLPALASYECRMGPPFRAADFCGRAQRATLPLSLRISRRCGFLEATVQGKVLSQLCVQCRMVNRTLRSACQGSTVNLECGGHQPSTSFRLDINMWRNVRFCGIAVLCALASFAGAQADGGDVSIALLQLDRAANSTAPQRLGAALAAFESAASAGVDVAVMPGAWLKQADAASLAQIQAASARLDTAIVASCCDVPGNDTMKLWLYGPGSGETGPLLTRGVHGSGANATVAVLAAGSGNVSIALLTDADLLAPEVSRLHMLRSSELWLWSSEHRGGVPPAMDAIGYTRGFENVAVVARAVAAQSARDPAMIGERGPPSGRVGAPWPDSTSFSSAVSYCAGLYPAGASGAASADDPPPDYNCTIVRDTEGTGGIVVASYAPELQRHARTASIWGDAFRRPFTYRDMCDSNSGEATARAAATTTGTAVNVTVALLQLVPGATPAACADAAESAIRDAAARGADVALLPELFSVGYDAFFPGVNGTAGNVRDLFSWADLASPVQGSNAAFVNRFRSLAQELGVAIGATFLQANATGMPGHPPRNTVALIDRHGNTVYAYSKVHTCDWSLTEAMTEPGRNFWVGRLDTAKGSVPVGSMICADREFPESARMLASHGAALLLVPNACWLGQQQLRQFRARAVENGVAVAMANYGSPYRNGQSIAFDSQGVLRGYGGSGAGIVMASIPVYQAPVPLTTAQGARAGLGSAVEELCAPMRNAAFTRPNVFGRVGGSVI